MAKTAPKRQKIGYALFVKYPHEQSSKYTRVGFLFNNAREASVYRESHFPTVINWSIQAIRVSLRQEISSNETQKT